MIIAAMRGPNAIFLYGTLLPGALAGPCGVGARGWGGSSTAPSVHTSVMSANRSPVGLPGQIKDASAGRMGDSGSIVMGRNLTRSPHGNGRAHRHHPALAPPRRVPPEPTRLAPRDGA